MINIIPSQNKFMVKIMYDELLKRIDSPTVGFPNTQVGRLKAEKLNDDDIMFIYVTSPIQKIIGLAKVKGPYFRENSRWPHQVPIDWIIPPRDPGVMLKEANITYRPNRGDSEFWISYDSAKLLINKLMVQYGYN